MLNFGASKPRIRTCVCQSFHSHGGLATPPWAAPPPGSPPRQTPPPAQCMTGYGQQAAGTHPTGMHTCSP